MRLCLASLLLLLVPGLAAQAFDPEEFFGSAWTAGTEPNEGSVRAPLAAPLPPFIDLGSSGNGDFRDRLTAAPSGLVIRADEKVHRTVQVGLDFGIATGQGSVEIIELDRGATVAWHLQPVGTAGRQHLCEVRHGADGLMLHIRESDGSGFRQLPGLRVPVNRNAIPGRLEFKMAEELTVTFGGVSLSTPVARDNGVRPAIAVSDGRARVANLEVSGKIYAPWLEDAAQRQTARRALMRLRELSGSGTVAGIAALAYPEEAADLKGYTSELLGLRSNAGLSAAGGAAIRSAALSKIAARLPANGLARHEAGVADLQFGDVEGAYSHLSEARKIRGLPLTHLALAEACRRLGRLEDARAELSAAQKNLPESLRADYALLLGRLQATAGELAGAAETLGRAAQAYSSHATLKEFAFSARSLTSPEGLVSVPNGPLGLHILSDVPERTLGSTMARLAPYLEKMRYWLPALPERVDGTVVVYAGPVSYLNAALIAAGDNLDNAAGMYLPRCIGGKPTILACRGFGEDELLRTLVHELWHLACAVAGGGAKTPRWIDEGMAVYLSSGRMQGQVLVFDRLPPEYSLSEAGSRLPVEWATTAVSAGPVEFYKPGRIRQNYAAAFALVWHLATADATSLKKLIQGNLETVQSVGQSLERLVAAAAEKLAKLEKA